MGIRYTFTFLWQKTEYICGNDLTFSEAVLGDICITIQHIILKFSDEYL